MESERLYGRDVALAFYLLHDTDTPFDRALVGPRDEAF